MTRKPLPKAIRQPVDRLKRHAADFIKDAQGRVPRSHPSVDAVEPEPARSDIASTNVAVSSDAPSPKRGAKELGASDTAPRKPRHRSACGETAGAGEQDCRPASALCGWWRVVAIAGREYCRGDSDYPADGETAQPALWGAVRAGSDAIVGRQHHWGCGAHRAWGRNDVDASLDCSWRIAVGPCRFSGRCRRINPRHRSGVRRELRERQRSARNRCGPSDLS